MSFLSKFKFSECFCFWNLMSWIIKSCSNFDYSCSESLTSNKVTSPPTLSFPVKIHFNFLENLKTRTDLINNFFKLLKRLQSVIFPIPNSLDFVIDKALTINLVLNSSIRTSGSILAFTVSNTGPFGDFKDSGPWNDNCGNTLGLHLRVALSAGFNSPRVCMQPLLSTFSLIFQTLFFSQTFQFLSTPLIQHKGTNESAQQAVLLATTSTNIALTTALNNFGSKRQDKSPILGIDKLLLDTNFDLALTNLSVILSLNIVLA